MTLAVAGSLTLGFAAAARSQHTPDPYNIVGEYNNQYEPYMFATYPTVPGTQPNQARLEGRSGLRNANSFQSFLDSEGDDQAEFSRAAPRASGPGIPYYKAYRRFDQEFQRTYRPNEMADKSYYNDQKQRNEKYFQALRESDPLKRSHLLRDYNVDNMRNARNLSGGRNAADRDRETTQDALGTGGASLYPEEREATKEETVRPSPGIPIRRPLSRLAPSGSPPNGTNSNRNPLTSGNRPSTPPTTSTVRSPASRLRTRSPLRTDPSAADVLNRSERLDRSGPASAAP